MRTEIELPQSVLPARTRVLEHKSGWKAIDFDELWEYRDLFLFLVRRDVKVRYAQSTLGIGWAVVQPLFFMLIFSFVFGILAKIQMDGVPYIVGSYVALVPWIFFSESLVASTNSLVQNAGMLTKVYFPRLVLPMSAVASKLVDFAIASVLIGVMLVWYQITPTVWVLALPVLILLMILSAAGMGMWLTSLAIQFRDVKYAMAFVTQLLMYAAPVAFPVSLIPHEFRLLYAIYPMTGVIEGFRSALLNTNPMPWDMIGIGFASSTVIFISGAMYFRRTERIFADVA